MTTQPNNRIASAFTLLASTLTIGALRLQAVTVPLFLGALVAIIAACWLFTARPLPKRSRTMLWAIAAVVGAALAIGVLVQYI